MSSAKYELDFLKAGIEQLKNYLLSNEIYWHLNIMPPAGGLPYPEFTLGWMLLFMKRAKALALNSEERTQLQKVKQDIEAMHSQWRAAWEKKAAREFQNRLFLWRDFLELYRENPEDNYDRYHYEVTRRVILELLKGEISVIPTAQAELLVALDRMLKAVLTPKEFIWDPALKKEFPKSQFWYLYGTVPKSK